MGRTLETKKEILSRLKNERKTVTQLSEELGLSKATISQHLSELKSMGAVEEDDNSHFRKLKYFRLADAGRRTAGPTFGTFGRVVTVVAVIAAIGAVYAALLFMGGAGPAIPQSNSSVNPNASALTVTSVSAGGGSGPLAACPMLPYYRTANATVAGKIVGEIANGSPCYLSYINTTSRTIRVGAGVKYVSSNGTLSVPSLNYTYSLNSSQISSLAAPNQKYCWSYTVLDIFGINATRPEDCRPSIYT